MNARPKVSTTMPASKGSTYERPSRSGVLIREGGSEGPLLKGTFLVARSEADAPDIDGRVYVRGELPIGEFARVKVIGHTDYDLIAEPA